MKKTIYDLELHETMQVNSCTYVTQVPGGWLYEKYYDYASGIDEARRISTSVAFVPFNDEFQEVNTVMPLEP